MHAKNYITPAGIKRLTDELADLWKNKRPKLVETISWAASNGDRSENGDYIYGKKRLREIDSRIRFLNKRIDRADVVDNAGKEHKQVLFGATVTFCEEDGSESSVTIVGVDEIDLDRGRVSWVSPIAKVLIGREVGDVVTLNAPNGVRTLEIIEIEYNEID